MQRHIREGPDERHKHDRIADHDQRASQPLGPEVELTVDKYEAKQDGHEDGRWDCGSREDPLR